MLIIILRNEIREEMKACNHNLREDEWIIIKMASVAIMVEGGIINVMAFDVKLSGKIFER